MPIYNIYIYIFHHQFSPHNIQSLSQKKHESRLNPHQKSLRVRLVISIHIPYHLILQVCIPRYSFSHCIPITFIYIPFISDKNKVSLWNQNKQSLILPEMGCKNHAQMGGVWHCGIAVTTLHPWHLSLYPWNHWLQYSFYPPFNYALLTHNITLYIPMGKVMYPKKYHPISFYIPLPAIYPWKNPLNSPLCPIPIRFTWRFLTRKVTSNHWFFHYMEVSWNGGYHQIIHLWDFPL